MVYKKNDDTSIDIVTNNEVLGRAAIDRQLMTCIRSQQIKFLGHVLRQRGPESDCLLGRVYKKKSESSSVN